MKYVHRMGFIHRDLKPNNILVNGDGHALVSDFGAARPESWDNTLTPGVGTVHYAAPELFEADAVSTPKADVFSVGCVLYEILTRRIAFPLSLTAFELIQQRRNGVMPSVPDECGEFMQQLLPRCWARSPEERPSFSEILQEFENVAWKIIPGASTDEIGSYVRDLRAWEASNVT
jgi:serine/threonine protein kinase